MPKFKDNPRKIKTITVALAGNPNSGKTTIFNNLTGSHQHVGNYGGVTVEIKEGYFKHGGFRVNVVDLPGTYSLSAYSMEEIVTRNFIIHRHPDVVVNIVDASNLERNLYLSAQLRELGVPMVTVLNMADEMKKKGIEVDLQTLSEDIGAPVVTTVGSSNKGTRKLIEKIIEVGIGKWSQKDTPPVHYGQEIEDELQKIARTIELHTDPSPEKSNKNPRFCISTSPRWVALKLLENDQEVLKSLQTCQPQPELLEQLEASRKHLTAIFAEDPETLIAEQRYGYVRGLCLAVIQRTAEARMDISDKIDKVLTNRVLGLPIFACLMYLTFWLVFTVGETPMGWIESVIEHLSNIIIQHWPDGRALFLRSLIVDGIISGVGGVLVFVPNIILLFTAITLLEDTGYMARAAFIMDRLMKWVGLHGKSFIPMLTGFGCSVPAIMGTRILDNRRDRLTTILILPLMSCGARLPIYMLVIPAFFVSETQRATAMYSLYIIGIVIAIICAKLLRSTLFKGESSPFVMELPPYRIPTIRAILIHVWQRTRMYLKKAGTIILAFAIIMWALAAFPKIPAQQLQGLSPEQIQEKKLGYSFTGRIGWALAPVVKPMGFDWKIGTALVGALPAKELFVAQMGIVYAVGEAGEGSQALREILQKNYNPLIGFCITLFCLISAPCMATIAFTKRETGAWRWALLQFAYLTTMAYILTVIVYQVGSFLHIGTA